jgi:hypothetical protein
MTMLLTLWLLVPFCAAQVLQNHTHDQQPPPSNDTKINAKPKKRGPRALAVVEFLPGGKARLVPVALWIDDRFYDASLYGANPEPMALEPETVYEASFYGDPTGLFTVETPEQVKGNWVATGQWKPHLEMDEKLAQQKAKQPKPKPKGYDANDDRPVLKRGGSDSSASSQSSGGNSGSTQTASSSSGSSGKTDSPEPSDRPILKKPEPAPAPAPDSTATTASSSTPSASPASTASPDESDPNRPVLRRGPQPKQTASAPAAPSATGKQVAAMHDAQGKLMTTMAELGHHSYPAISDAGVYETRSLLYSMDSTERNNKSQQLRALAMDEIGKFIAKRKTTALPKGAAISDYDLRAYDLDFSNSPTFVLTATLPVAGAKALRGGEFDYYVTVVAREDINGTPIKIFSLVSDSNHLDAFPQLEIIDAVDADANGRGDLLFREHSDSGVSYSLYRVYPYDMQKVFEGGASL